MNNVVYNPSDMTYEVDGLKIEKKVFEDARYGVTTTTYDDSWISAPAGAYSTIPTSTSVFPSRLTPMFGVSYSLVCQIWRRAGLYGRNH